MKYPDKGLKPDSKKTSQSVYGVTLGRNATVLPTDSKQMFQKMVPNFDFQLFADMLKKVPNFDFYLVEERLNNPCYFLENE